MRQSAKTLLPLDICAMWLAERVLGVGQIAALADPTPAMSFTEGETC